MAKSRELRIRQAKKLLAQNLARDEIAEKMNKSRSTIDKYLAEPHTAQTDTTDSNDNDGTMLQAAAWLGLEPLDREAVECAAENASIAYGWLSRSCADINVLLETNGLEKQREDNSTGRRRIVRIGATMAHSALRDSISAMQQAHKTLNIYKRHSSQPATAISRKELQENMQICTEALAEADLEIRRQARADFSLPREEKSQWLKETHESLQSAVVAAQNMSSAVDQLLGIRRDTPEDEYYD